METGTEGYLKPELFFNNEVSLHDLIADHVRRLSPAAVILTTFSLSEVSIREFIELLESGDLASLVIITDFTVRKNKLDMLLFASENASLYLTDVHAKVALISNLQEEVVILSTSNLNAIKRYEAGAVFYDPDSIAFFKNHLDQLIAESMQFEANDTY